MTAQLYWRDIESRQGRWVGLGVQVEGEARKPELHLLTGNNWRMQLMLGATPLFWATMAGYCDGVWLIRNAQAAEALQLLPSISSAEVEQHQALAPDVRLKAWSRHFVSQLHRLQTDFFYPGYWIARGLLPDPDNIRGIERNGVSAWSFASIDDTSSHLPGWRLRGRALADDLAVEPVHWINWWSHDSNLLRLRRVDPTAGRLKWWRKKAREGSLPPILLWFVGGLSAYVVLDGHYRLQAAIEENRPPQFIVLSSTHIRPVQTDPDWQQQVLETLRRQIDKYPNFNPASMNDVLIHAFDDRPEHSPQTHTWVGIGSDQAWVDDVSRHLHAQGETGHLQDIIQRKA